MSGALAVYRPSALVDAYGQPLVMAAQMGTPSSAYDGGARGRLLDSLHAPDLGINASLVGSLDLMRARCRALYRSNPMIRKVVNTFVAQIVGTGFTPLPDLDPDEVPEAETISKAMKRLWADWVRYSDADGRTNLHGQMVAIGKMWALGGEGLIRFRPRLPTDVGIDGVPLPLPLQLQILAAEHLPTDWSMPVNGTNNEILSGVEFDGIGRRVAYWLYPRRPNELHVNFRANTYSPVRIRAEDVLHFGEIIDAGQVRYEPPLAAAIVKVHRLDIHDEAQLERQLIAALYSLWFTTPDGSLGPAGAGADPNGADDGGRLKVVWKPGQVGLAPPGFKLEATSPPQLPQEYDVFQRQQRLEICGVGRVTYSGGTGDFRGTTYSAERSAENQNRRELEQLQYTQWQPQLLDPIRTRVIMTAVRTGKLPIDPRAFNKNPLAYLRVRWMPQGWRWVDPESEVNAICKAIDYGITSRDEEIGMQGWDPEEVDRARKRGQDREEQLDLPITGSGVATRRPSDFQASENQQPASTTGGTGSSTPAPQNSRTQRQQRETRRNG